MFYIISKAFKMIKVLILQSGKDYFQEGKPS